MYRIIACIGFSPSPVSRGKRIYKNNKKVRFYDMVINVLFEDFIKKYESEIKGLGIKKPEDYFMQEYYDYICESLRSGDKITQNVYDNIPDLHYWIEHTFIIHGYNVVA